jgi:hypothetical protein
MVMAWLAGIALGAMVSVISAILLGILKL